MAGVMLTGLWLASQAATVAPGSPAETMRWAAGHLLAFLAGVSFALAIHRKR